MKLSLFVLVGFLFLAQGSLGQDESTGQGAAATEAMDNESSEAESSVTDTFHKVMKTVKDLAKTDPDALLKFHPDNCNDAQNDETGAGAVIKDQLCKLSEDEQWLAHSLVQDQFALLEKLVEYSEEMASDVMQDLCNDEEESLLCVLAKAVETGIIGVGNGKGKSCSLFDLATIASDPQMYFDQFGIDIENCLNDDEMPPPNSNGEKPFLCKEINTFKKTVDAFTALMDSLNEDGIPSLFSRGTECSDQDNSDYCKVRRLLDTTMNTVETVEKWANVDVTGEMQSILKTISNEIDCSDPENLAFCASDLHNLVKDTVQAVEDLAGQLTNDDGDFSIMSSVENVVKEIESVNKYAVFGEAIFEIISDPGMIKNMFIYQSPKEFCDYSGNGDHFIICSTDMDYKLKKDMMDMIETVWNPTYSRTVGVLVEVATKPEALGRVLQDTSLEFCRNGESIPDSLDALCYLVRDRQYNELIDLIVSAGSSINAMAPLICSGMEEYERVISLVKMFLNETVVDTLMELAENEMECLLKDMDIGDIFDFGRLLPSNSKKSGQYIEETEDDSTDILPLVILILLILAILLLVLVLFMQYRLMKEIFRSRRMLAVQNLPKESKSVPNVYKSPDVDNIEKSIFLMNSDPLSVPRNLRQPANLPPPPPKYNVPSPIPGSVDGSSVKSLDTSYTNASYTELIDEKAGGQ